MTTALFVLRCVELGVSITDMDLLTIGMLTDMFIEKGKDGEKSGTKRENIIIAGQREMDAF